MPRHLKIPKKFIACTVFTFASKNGQAAIQHPCICASISHMAASGGCSQIIYCHRAENIVTLVHSVSITCFPHSGEVVWRIFFFLDWRANRFLFFFGESGLYNCKSFLNMPFMFNLLCQRRWLYRNLSHTSSVLSSVNECITFGEIQQLHTYYQFQDVHIRHSLYMASTSFVEWSSVRLKSQAHTL